MRSHTDRGNASILMMGVLAMSLSGVVALASLDNTLTTSMSAQAVADAVALAAVEQGSSTAHALAELNGARLVSSTVVESRLDGSTTIVVVIEIDGVQSRATASNAD